MDITGGMLQQAALCPRTDGIFVDSVILMVISVCVELFVGRVGKTRNCFCSVQKWVNVGWR